MSAGKLYEEAPLMYLVYLKDPGKAILTRVSSVQSSQMRANASLMFTVTAETIEALLSHGRFEWGER